MLSRKPALEIALEITHVLTMFDAWIVFYPVALITVLCHFSSTCAEESSSFGFTLGPTCY